MAELVSYPFQKTSDLSKLTTEILAARLSVNLDHIDSNDSDDGKGGTITKLDIWFVDILPASDFDTLSLVVQQHDPKQSVSDKVRARIVAAREFGQNMIDEVAIDNILAGITTDQVVQILIKYGPIMGMLQSGSLYTALAAMQASPPDNFITPDRIAKYIAQLKAYLGIP